MSQFEIALHFRVYGTMRAGPTVAGDPFLSPSPGHRPLLRLALWQVVPSEANHLKPIGALVSPLVGLVAGNVEVARGLGVVTQGCFL